MCPGGTSASDAECTTYLATLALANMGYYNMLDKEVERFVGIFDPDGDGVITYLELVTFATATGEEATEKRTALNAFLNCPIGKCGTNPPTPDQLRLSDMFPDTG